MRRIDATHVRSHDDRVRRRDGGHSQRTRREERVVREYCYPSEYRDTDLIVLVFVVVCWRDVDSGDARLLVHRIMRGIQ